jgi:hypothetical protein
VIYDRAHHREFGRFGGLAVTFVVFLFSLAGLPPLAGLRSMRSL